MVTEGEIVLSDRTRKRDRRRSPEELSIVQLARELGRLSSSYPRFKSPLLKLQAYVTNQLQSAQSKKNRIERCLKESGWPLLDIDELVSDTNLDRESVKPALDGLVKAGKVDEVNRDGVAPRKTKDGRPTDHVYYRLRKKSEKKAGRS